MKQYLNAADVAGIMECSVNHAYKVIRGLNDELKRKGTLPDLEGSRQSTSTNAPALVICRRRTMNLDKFLQELDLNTPPDERTCKQIYGFEIGNPGIAEKVMRMYEESWPLVYPDVVRSVP